MVDFSKLLSKPAGEAKKPPALPAGNYSGIIKGYEYGDQNKNKTPYVRIAIGLIAPNDPAIDESELAGVELSKRAMRRDFYVTDDALWRLDEFIKSLSIDMTGRTYEEVIPELVGLNVVAEVQQYLNQQNGEIGNQIGKLTGE